MQSREPNLPIPGSEPATLDRQRSGGLGQAVARALDRPDCDLSSPPGDPGAIEYASWLRLLRRTAP